jgi:hypothetical protein
MASFRDCRSVAAAVVVVVESLAIPLTAVVVVELLVALVACCILRSGEPVALLLGDSGGETCRAAPGGLEGRWPFSDWTLLNRFSIHTSSKLREAGGPLQKSAVEPAGTLPGPLGDMDRITKLLVLLNGAVFLRAAFSFSYDKSA